MKTNTTLKQILLEEAERTYLITEKLFRMVSNSDLKWKPSTGKNWMTMAQLLMHCASFGCGKAVQGFVKGDWGMPEDINPENLNAEQHVPPADELPGAESVEQALKILSDDKALTLHCIFDVQETALLRDKFKAPWGGSELTLFQHLLMMIAHLAQHKGQLFYYLKLMEKEVNTSDLWGE